MERITLTLRRDDLEHVGTLLLKQTWTGTDAESLGRFIDALTEAGVALDPLEDERLTLAKALH